MASKLAGLIVTTPTYGGAILYLLVAFLVPGCDSTDGNENIAAEYTGDWVTETPVDTTISMTVAEFNAQPGLVEVEVEGELTVFLGFNKDGVIDINFSFASENPPLCSSADPCTLHGTSIGSYKHQYVDKRITPEGLDAYYVRIIDETGSDSASGFAYVAENRLCISNGVWDFLLTPEAIPAVDPLAIDFDRCLVRVLEP